MACQSHISVAQACQGAGSAFAMLSAMSPQQRAAMLDAIAAALDGRRDEILATCSDETALTIEELTPEFARMTGTLRMFAGVVREGSWVRAAVDTKQSPGGDAGSVRVNQEKPGVTAGALSSQSSPLVGPNHDIRSMLVPLGPVAVFGSSNFPLAYGVCGGDTASALAAGCPVIVKEHPAHPRTGRLLAEIALSAVPSRKNGAWGGHVPCPFLKYVRNENPNDYSVAEALVGHAEVVAVGFTGSISGGLAIEKIARKRSMPIPVFAEMGSNNVVAVLASAARKRGAVIAEQVADSILARNGQQCTCPGLILIESDDEGASMAKAIAQRLDAASPRRMLSSIVSDRYGERCEQVLASRDIRLLTMRKLPFELRGTERRAVPMLFEFQTQGTSDLDEIHCSSREFHLLEEIFGPAAVVVRGCVGTVHYNLEWIKRNRLVTSVYAEEDDLEQVQGMWGLLGSESGRLAFNSVPTGVRVATGMVHGGPFPATNVPHTTAVGPRAMERWCRPVCWQNCPDGLLPEELREGNPRGIWRVVDGVFGK